MNSLEQTVEEHKDSSDDSFSFLREQVKILKKR